MCVGLFDVGTVIKYRFLTSCSKLQAQHSSSDLLDLCYCELRHGATILFHSLLRVFFSSSFRF